MRTLFTCVPGFGHFYPMVPLARAMQGAGHEVAFATAARFCRNVVEPAGFSAFSAGLSPLQAQDALATEATPATEAPATEATPPSAGAEASAPWRRGALLFAGPAASAKAADLTAVITSWQPRLVVHDAVDFGAALAASATGLPYASHSFGALQRRAFWDLAGAVAGHGWRERGMEPEPHGGMFRHLYLDICPPLLQSPDIADVAVARPMRPVVCDISPAGRTPWLRLLPGLRTVYVSMGTVFNTTPGLFETILGALGGEPFNVIATVGLDRDPAEFGPQPANVHVARYLPQAGVLPRCDMVVCHGGSGTVLGALAHGLPLLLLPQGANQEWNARRCAAIGAGAVIEPHELTRAMLAHKVREVAGTASYRAGAQSVQREIAAMPSPGDAVRTLEELAGEGVQRRGSE